MTTATATAYKPNAKAIVQAHINAAIDTPQAKGMKGFLIWVKAAFPARIANVILNAAERHAQVQHLNASASPMGAYGAYMKAKTLGSYDGPTTFGWVPPAVQARINRLKRTGVSGYGLGALGQTGASSTASSAITATPSSAATPSWMTDITSAIQAAGQAYLTKTQISDAQTIFDTNLQRAQMGLSPLPTNPVDYGLPSPQLNVGLASGTQNLILYGGIAAAVIGVGFLIVHATKK